MNLEEVASELNSQTHPETPQTLLVYGAPKTGKTTLVAQLAKKYKVIWVDTEKGYQTLLSCLPKEYWKNITLIRVHDVQETSYGIKTVLAIFRAKGPIKLCDLHGAVSCAICTAQKKTFTTLDPTTWDTSYVLVNDSLTQISDSAMAHVIGGSSDGYTFKKKEFQHYDNQGLILKNILNAQQRMKCHSVFISHEEELEQEDGSKKLTPVGGTRNFSKVVARYFDHVVYTSIRNKKHCMNSVTTGDLKVQAGSRNNVDLKKADDILGIFTINVADLGKGTKLEFVAEAEMEAQDAEAMKDLEGEETINPTPEESEVPSAVVVPPVSSTNAIAARLAQAAAARLAVKK